MKRIVVIMCVVSLLCVSCKSKSQIQASSKTDRKSAVEQTENRLTLQDSLINYGRNYLRVPYRYGGTTSKGFDCSGFTSHVYKNFGYNLNRASRDQANQFPAVQKKDLQTGDLVFFEGRRKNNVVGHVGIVTSTKPNGEFDFIHASVQQGVTISSSTEAYYSSRYLKAGRVISNNTNTTYLRASNASPESGSNTITNKEVIAEPKKNIVENVYHTVRKGDNLALIAKKYDVPISTIQHLNNLTSKKIKRGQKLLITEAVSIPEIPIVGVQKVDFDKTAEQNERQFIALEPQPRIEIKSVAEIEAQQTNPETNTVSSQKVEQQEKAEVVIMETRQTAFQSSYSKHKVVAGESLFSIARKYNLSVEELKALNNLTSNAINAGKILIVAKIAETQQEIQATEIVPARAETTYHTVKAGDTLYSLARQYGCSVNDLRKWNPNMSDAIKIGERIKINP